MGTHLRVLSECFLLNTNMIGFGWFSMHPCALDVSSLSIGRVKIQVIPFKPVNFHDKCCLYRIF